MTDNLVALRAGTGSALVFAHPGSGLITAFRRLFPHLAWQDAVFALENPEPRRSQCSISDLAADYWAQLAAATSGPFVFAGWSFGGAVALDMAGAAEESGHQVAAVVLIDAAAPHILRSARPVPLSDLAGLFEVDPAEVRTSTAPSSDEEDLAAIVEVLRVFRGMPEIETTDLQPFVDTYRWHLSVNRRPWRPAGCQAPTFLVRASDEAGWSDAPADLGWSSVLGRTPVMLWTPGTHYTLMSHEHAPDLAEVLSTMLAALREPDASAHGALT